MTAERIKAAKHALGKTEKQAVRGDEVWLERCPGPLDAAFIACKVQDIKVLQSSSNAELVEFMASKEGSWGLGHGYTNG